MWGILTLSTVKEIDMKINVKKEQVIKAIKEAEGRATARTITEQDVQDWAEKVEKHLEGLLPKAHRIGVVARIDEHAQQFPNSYKYTPESTKFDIKRFPSGWFLVNVFRGATNGSTGECTIQYTDKQKEKIIETVSII